MKYTAPRIVAAVLLTLLAGYVSGLVKIAMPETTDFGNLTYANMAVGALIGWFLMGRNAGRGFSDAISSGITSTAAAVFCALFAQSSNEMLRLALLRRYDGPLEGITAIFQIMADYGAILVNAEIVLTLVVGGILAGIVTEISTRYWS